MLGTNDIVPRTRKTWSKREEAAILKAFGQHFKCTTIPGKIECLQTQQKYSILKTRTWKNLKYKVRNFKLEIERQSVKGNLVKRNSNKGKKYERYGRLDGIFNQ